jgi:hypothetical protein
MKIMDFAIPSQSKSRATHGKYLSSLFYRVSANGPVMFASVAALLAEAALAACFAPARDKSDLMIALRDE